MAEKETRNFALRDKDGNEIGVFTGKAPRQAALKAANRGITDIRLRERGTKKVLCIHRRACANKETQERTSMDASQDLEAYSQESGCRETRIILTPLFVLTSFLLQMHVFIQFY